MYVPRSHFVSRLLLRVSLGRCYRLVYVVKSQPGCYTVGRYVGTTA